VDLLMLGGSVFLGRHLVDAALERGHHVTIFTRGQHIAETPAHVERLTGDRDGDLRALEGRRWDAVIDTSGYVPRVVRASAKLLAPAVGHYTFISSVSAYRDFSVPGMDESASVGTLADETVEEVNGETYGPLKALCERAVEAAMPDRALVIRPGLIVGPYDPTDRFTYWPHRVAEGGEVLAPGRPGRPVQFIDARDLAEWAVRMAETGATGIYHATGPAEPLSMERTLDVCRSATGSTSTLKWVSDEFLSERGVDPWMELPLWIPETELNMRGFLRVDCGKAIAAGLAFRPLEMTVRDTLAWDHTRPREWEWKAGMSRDREADLLAAWRAQGG
jgi:nucleoside-diphosphate-sugar epimerase